MTLLARNALVLGSERRITPQMGTSGRKNQMDLKTAAEEWIKRSSKPICEAKLTRRQKEKGVWPQYQFSDSLYYLFYYVKQTKKANANVGSFISLMVIYLFI